MTEQINPGAGCLTHAALCQPPALQAAFLPVQGFPVAQHKSQVLSDAKSLPEQRPTGPQRSTHSPPILHTHQVRHSFTVGSLTRAQQITHPSPLIHSTELRTANSTQTRGCTAFLIKAPRKKDYGVCLPKPPLCVWRPCFAGNGWASAC